MTINFSKNAIIFGATSSLTQSICHELAKKGKNLTLIARNKEELSLLKNDLEIRYNIEVTTIIYDISNNVSGSGADNIEDVVLRCLNYDLVFITIGDMGSDNFDDITNIQSVIDINFTKPAILATKFSENLVDDNNIDATIAIISSVAGDRGRQSNYIYGSAKAGISAFCSGLRNRYAKTNLHIITIKPGFVDTPMTYAMDSPLTVNRNFVAKKIIIAIEKKKDVLYVPFFWKYIMLIIKNIPERIFKKLNL